MILNAQEEIYLFTAIRHEKNDFPHKAEALDRIKEKIQLTETPRRGRWIYQPNDEHLKPYEKVKFYRCSECGRLISVAPFYETGKSLDEFPYCHCGAKMKGGEE